MTTDSNTVKTASTWLAIKQALKETRKNFSITTKEVEGTLNDSINLYLSVATLISKFAKGTDDEKYALETTSVAFKRVLGSYFMLESGFPQEAHMLLRNVIELILISIDTLHNPESLKEWKKTADQKLEDTHHNDLI